MSWDKISARGRQEYSIGKVEGSGGTAARHENRPLQDSRSHIQPGNRLVAERITDECKRQEMPGQWGDIKRCEGNPSQ